jgi:two-component system, response regulator PdtaR
MGYGIVGVASRADRAIELARQHHPDLALMDVHIQGDQDGTETARMLRDEFNVPSVFLTAYSDDQTIKSALASNPLGYLVKPFVDRELRAAVELALYKNRTDRQLAAYREQLETKVKELEVALGQVRELSALLPICAWCKSIRNEDGYWEEVSSYISSHTNTSFTHGLCEDCQQKMMREAGMDGGADG